ncbi:MAG: NAD-dependent deacylase [Gemmatimonadota bacterium]|nr:NAD-dependent deacylase [Gemmatimonadota bacterium]
MQATKREADLPRARELIAQARRVVALTGAGISAESGVPTFRDAGGLWRNYRPEELATIGAFERDPRTVWEWYEWRRGFLATCNPNDGHRALARFFLGRGEDGIVTQNVDGLHTRAAIEEAGDAPPDAALPIEIHGAIARDRCNECGLRAEAEPLADRDERARGTGADEAPSGDPLPRCAECGGLRRPDVVLFGEMLDSALLERAQTMAARADLCLVIGTSAVVYPAAGIPLATLHGGGRIIEVNPQATDLTRAAEVALRGAAGEVLPELLA